MFVGVGTLLMFKSVEINLTEMAVIVFIWPRVASKSKPVVTGYVYKIG